MWASPTATLVDLRASVRGEQLDWLGRSKSVRSDLTLSHTLRRVLDQAQQDDDVLAARAHASGYAALAAELAEQYRRDLDTGAGQVPGQEAALDLAACQDRCLAARRRLEQLQPRHSHTWPPLPTEADPELAEKFVATILQVAVEEQAVTGAIRG